LQSSNENSIPEPVKLWTREPGKKTANLILITTAAVKLKSNQAFPPRRVTRTLGTTGTGLAAAFFAFDPDPFFAPVGLVTVPALGVGANSIAVASIPTVAGLAAVIELPLPRLEMPRDWLWLEL
jgi:hypothetical protein